jgi:Ty3 transposon capsid-like protein
MSNKNRVTFIPKSASLDSLHVLSTTDNSLLTSTTTQALTSKIPVNIQRRKALIPTPNRPPVVTKSPVMSDEQDPSMTERTINQSTYQDNTDDSLKLNSLDDDQHLETSLHRKYPTAQETDIVSSANVNSRDRRRMSIVDNYLDEQDPLSTTVIASRNLIERSCNANDSDIVSQSDDNRNDDNFDTFVLDNFVRFTGKEDVVQWFDQTEHKFNELRVGQRLRFKAIPLLIEGLAKRKYVIHKNPIRSFDNFYEFLLSEFDKSDIDTNQCNCTHGAANYQPSNLMTPFKPRSTDNSTSTDVYLNDSTKLIRQTPAFCSTAVIDVSATTLGEMHAATSVNSANNLSASDCDRTLIDLRKAIVASLIRNPKTFAGGKDDVTKWIEEIEHLLEVAHIPDSTRLDLISYSLRGDALEWYKSNKSTLNCWITFVTEIKRAFTSSFHEEMAFKRLESYTQGANQPIRNFFNEILKLCKEADSTMSESTKLKNLVNKTRPTIQFEVRKKKPTNTSQFLEYAKEAEELLQLSSMTMEDNSAAYVHTSHPHSVAPLTSASLAPTNQSFDNRTNNSSSNDSRNYNQDYHSSQNRNAYSNSKPAWDKSASRPSPQYNQNKPRYNQNNSQTNRDKFPSNTQNYTQKKQSQYSNNSSRDAYPSQASANTINPSYQSPPTDPSQEMFSSILCARCNQLGHEATACPSF